MNFIKNRGGSLNSDKIVKFRNLIKDGDLVIIYERHDSLDHLYAKKDLIFKNKFGTLFFY